jgi:hypothetical protein
VQDKEAGTDRDKETGDEARLDEVTLKSSGEVVLIPKESLSKPPEDKHIHPRRPLPLIPESPPEDKEDGKR